MEPDEDYEWDYYVWQEVDTDSEIINWFATLSFRRLKPLWISSFIPFDQEGDKETKMIIYPDLDISKFPSERNGEYLSQKIDLPNKKIKPQSQENCHDEKSTHDYRHCLSGSRLDDQPFIGLHDCHP